MKLFTSLVVAAVFAVSSMAAVASEAPVKVEEKKVDSKPEAKAKAKAKSTDTATAPKTDAKK